MRFSRADRLTDVVHFKSWLRLPPLRHGCRGSSALWREKFDLFITAVFLYDNTGE